MLVYGELDVGMYEASFFHSSYKKKPKKKRSANASTSSYIISSRWANARWTGWTFSFVLSIHHAGFPIISISFYSLVFHYVNEKCKRTKVATLIAQSWKVTSPSSLQDLPWRLPLNTLLEDLPLRPPCEFTTNFIHLYNYFISIQQYF